jgi:hypothetical protein
LSEAHTCIAEKRQEPSDVIVNFYA